MAQANPETWHKSKIRHSVPLGKLGPPYPGVYALVFVVTFAVAWFALYAVSMRREIDSLKLVIQEEIRLREQFQRIADLHRLTVQAQRLDRLEQAVGLPPMEDAQ